MKKWIKFIIILILIIVAIFFIFNKFVKLDYKNTESGNNKSIKEIEEYFLNVNSYTAKIKVTVTSNKNVNFYELTQEVKLPQTARQVANLPEELSGVEMIYKDGVLEIKNSKYNLTKIYKDYPYVSNNQLFLTSFLEGYRNSEEKQIEEKDNRIKMQYKSGTNKYNNTQVLYINKTNLKPESLDILDVNKDCKVNILYKEIEF